MFKEIKSDIFLDLVKLTEENPFDKLDLLYTNRQKEWESKNSKIISNFLDYLYPKWREKFKEKPTSITLNNFIALCKRSNNPKINEVLETALKDFNYNYQSELIQIILLLDLYLSHKINIIDLKHFLKGYLSYIDIKEDTLELFLEEGSSLITTVSSALSIEHISYNERKQNCHYLTSSALTIFPDLYGAYYYLPKTFIGYAEHSVIIDFEKRYVYDLANNIAINLDLFMKYYGYPSFIIKGSEFTKLDKMIEDKYGISLSMYQIEELQRRKTKELK